MSLEIAFSVLLIVCALVVDAFVQAWIIQGIVRRVDPESETNTTSRAVGTVLGIWVVDAGAALGGLAFLQLARHGWLPIPLVLAGQVLLLLVPWVMPSIAFVISYRMRWPAAVGSSVFLLIERMIVRGVIGLTLMGAFLLHPAVPLLVVTIGIAVFVSRWRTAVVLERIARGEA